MEIDHLGVRNGLALLTATFGGTIDSWQRRAYVRALDGIPDEILMVGAERLIDEAASGRKFYPLPNAPDWKAACSAVISTRRQAAASLHLARCEHSGYWIENERGEMQRCPCWVMAQAAMASVGQLLMLPPSIIADERVDA